jgi:hypothetical protein
LNKPKSQFFEVGPLRMFTPLLPKVFGAGTVNALGSNQRSRVGFERFPLAIRFGRLGVPVSAGSVNRVGVKGPPDWATRMLVSSQPPSASPREPVRFLKNRTSYTPPNVKTVVGPIGAYSAFVLLKS